MREGGHGTTKSKSRAKCQENFSPSKLQMEAVAETMDGVPKQEFVTGSLCTVDFFILQLFIEEWALLDTVQGINGQHRILLGKCRDSGKWIRLVCHTLNLK